MNTFMKTTLIAATIAGGLTATSVAAQTTALAPVDRFEVSDINRAAFDANLVTLGIDLRPGDTLTANDRDFARRIMNADIFDSVKIDLIRALYADDDASVTSNGIY